MTAEHAVEVESGERFEFGENWSRFLKSLDEARIRGAEHSLRAMLRTESLKGKRFLDVGSGSGLFSLAARRLGATVQSFDYDPKSVACTRELKRRYFENDADWIVESGSILDTEFVARLGQHDIVYSWGVLHHTGQMYKAFAAVVNAVAPGGQLFIAIYNDQRFVSRYWLWVKRSFNKSRVARFLITVIHAPYLFGLRWLIRAARRAKSLERGMTLWYDMLDWLGGYPFEVARPEQVFSFFRERGLELTELTTCGGRHGCNEFVFRRQR